MKIKKNANNAVRLYNKIKSFAQKLVGSTTWNKISFLITIHKGNQIELVFKLIVDWVATSLRLWGGSFLKSKTQTL
jgi:hypothetical protein